MSDATLAIGHVRLHLKQGTIARVSAGDEPIGFFFKGLGSWSYVSEAPEEFPSLQRNAKEVSKWKPALSGGRATITDEFSELLWLSTEADRLLESPSEASPPAGAFPKHLERFARLQTEGFAQRFAYRKLAGSAKPLAWGQFTGGKNDALYVYDAVLEDREEISVLKKIEASGYEFEPEFWVLRVSEQPISRRFRDRPAVPVGLSRVEVAIEADGEHARITTKQTFLARSEPLRVLNLSLRNRVWNPSSHKPMPHRLLRVRDSSGKEIPFDHRRATVLAELPQPIAPGEAATLEFEMEGDFLYRPGGDNFWMLGLDDWFPSPPLEASAFTWASRVKVKKPFIPLASGRTVDRREEGDWNLVSTELDQPIFLPIVLAGKYKISEDTRNGRTIRVAGYAFGYDRAAKQMTALASQIIEFYEVFLGPFPWKEFTIIEINAYGFGIAPPATMFITHEAFATNEDDVSRFFSKGLNERFAHEIAHQYWGHQVKFASELDGWLSESFAEYCAGLAVRRMRGERAFGELVARWKAAAKEAGAHGTIPTADRLLGERGMRDDRSSLLYGKGPYLLYALHQELGDQVFFTFLKTFQANLRWKYGSTTLVADLLQHLTKKQYGDFFDRYFWGTEIPEISR